MISLARLVRERGGERRGEWGMRRVGEGESLSRSEGGKGYVDRGLIQVSQNRF